MAFLNRTPPPFCANEDNNLHCGQACLRMAHEHFTGLHLSAANANDCTDYDLGNDAFLPAMLRHLANSGLAAVHIEFGRTGLSAHAALTYEDRIPDITDIVEALTNGCVIVTSLNYFGLMTESGQPVSALNYFGLYGESERYSGHYVLLYDIDVKNRMVRLHNPGLPALPAQETSFENLLRAMHSPKPEAANMTAIRRAA